MVDPYDIVRRLTGHELISPKDARLLIEAVDGLIDEIGSKNARIAELEAEVERLKDQLGDPEGTIAHADAIISQAEALASIGAVKVKALEDALRGLLKAYENAFDWSVELPPETVEAERVANEVLHALTEGGRR